MSLRKSLFAAGWVASSFCLVAGYALVGQWIGGVGAVIVAAAWLLARKYPVSGIAFICLLSAQGLAVGGCLSGVPPLLMILGSGLSLAVWDLTLLNAMLDENTFTEQARRYESQHIQSLSMALGAGMLIAFAGHFLRLQLPFVVLMLFVGLFLFGMDRAWGYIKKIG